MKADFKVMRAGPGLPIGVWDEEEKRWTVNDTDRDGLVLIRTEGGKMTPIRKNHLERDFVNYDGTRIEYAKLPLARPLKIKPKDFNLTTAM